MKIDLNCPVEIWKLKPPTPDYQAVELTLFNLSDKPVVSVEVTLLLRDAEGEECGRLIDRNRDLNGQPGCSFHMPVAIPEDLLNSQQMDAVVEKAWYEDGTVWRRGRAPLTNYRSNALPPGRELDALRAVAGENLVAGFPEEQGELWLCVCGRPNVEQADRCIRCGREKRLVFSSYSRAAVAGAVGQRQRMLSEQTRTVLRAAQEEDSGKAVRRKKERRWVLPLVVCLVLVLCAAAAGVVWGLPYLRYRQAISAMEGGRVAEAQAAFEEMGDYRDAADYVLRCRYQLAEQQYTDALEAGDGDGLARAREAFTALNGYSDSAERVLQCEYQRAALLLGEGHPQQAEELFLSLGDYLDSPAQASACAYERAAQLLESGSYDEAHSAFVALGSYQDSAEKALQCYYRPGKAALADARWDDAIASLGTLREGERAGGAGRQRGCRRRIPAGGQLSGRGAARGRLHLQPCHGADGRRGVPGRCRSLRPHPGA